MNFIYVTSEKFGYLGLFKKLENKERMGLG
jgi:hypothetical protein